MAGSVRPIVTKAGYTWTDDNPRYRIAARYIFGPEQNATHGMIVLRATQEVVLIDGNDSVIKSTKLNLKGVGGTEGQAMLQLETRMDEQLKSTLANWLGTGGPQK